MSLFSIQSFPYQESETERREELMKSDHQGSVTQECQESKREEREPKEGEKEESEREKEERKIRTDVNVTRNMLFEVEPRMDLGSNFFSSDHQRIPSPSHQRIPSPSHQRIPSSHHLHPHQVLVISEERKEEEEEERRREEEERIREEVWRERFESRAEDELLPYVRRHFESRPEDELIPYVRRHFESRPEDELLPYVRRQRRESEEKSKSTCSDQALMISVIINILSLFLTIGVVVLVVTLMLAMAADSDLSFLRSDPLKASRPFPFTSFEYSENNPEHSTGKNSKCNESKSIKVSENTGKISEYSGSKFSEYSGRKNSQWSHKYKISDTQTIMSKFPFSPFPPLSSPVIFPSPSSDSSSLVISSSSSFASSSNEREEDIIGKNLQEAEDIINEQGRNVMIKVGRKNKIREEKERNRKEKEESTRSRSTRNEGNENDENDDDDDDEQGRRRNVITSVVVNEQEASEHFDERTEGNERENPSGRKKRIEHVKKEKEEEASSDEEFKRDTRANGDTTEEDEHGSEKSYNHHLVEVKENDEDEDDDDEDDDEEVYNENTVSTNRISDENTLDTNRNTMNTICITERNTLNTEESTLVEGMEKERPKEETKESQSKGEERKIEGRMKELLNTRYSKRQKQKSSNSIRDNTSGDGSVIENGNKNRGGSVIENRNKNRDRKNHDRLYSKEESMAAFGQIIALGPLLVLSSICGIAASQKHTGTTSVVIYWTLLTVTLLMSVYITSLHIDYDSIIGFDDTIPSSLDSSARSGNGRFKSENVANSDSRLGSEIDSRLGSEIDSRLGSEIDSRLGSEIDSNEVRISGEKNVEKSGNMEATTAIETVSTIVIVIGICQLLAAIVVTFAKYQKKRVAIFEKDPNYYDYHTGVHGQQVTTNAFMVGVHGQQVTTNAFMVGVHGQQVTTDAFMASVHRPPIVPRSPAVTLHITTNQLADVHD